MTTPNKSTVEHKKEHYGDLRPKGSISYVKGSRVPTLVYATIPQLLKQSVSQYGLRDALIFPNHVRKPLPGIGVSKLKILLFYTSLPVAPWLLRRKESAENY